MMLAFVNVHEIHTDCISFLWKFSQLSSEINRNFLSLTYFGSEVNYYNMEAKVSVFANFASKYWPLFIFSHL